MMSASTQEVPPRTTTPRPQGAPRSASPGPTRRTFLRNTWLLSWLGVLSAFGGASIAFLWPSLRGGFGAKLDVDTEENVLAHIRSKREPYVYAPGRLYLVEYDPALDRDGAYASITNGASVMAVYHRCVHLGCRVPWCGSSQWFECPCHGSQYNRWGEYQFGPAPRGLDRFALTVQDGRVIVDTSKIVTGPARQADQLAQPPEGPHCV
jgi:cytochrome b6-f complex iron-sulfur subunit